MNKQLTKNAQKSRAGDDRVCSPANSFFDNNKKSRAGDDRVCSPATSFFDNNKKDFGTLSMSNVEEEILKARISSC